MAREWIELGEDTTKAAAAITKNRFVGFDGLHCGAGKKAYGVSRFDIPINEYGSIVLGGVVVVESGGALTKGKPVKSDANGKAVEGGAMDGVVDSGAVAVTSSAANGNILTLNGSEAPEVINGYAIEAASGAGEFIRILCS